MFVKIQERIILLHVMGLFTCGSYFISVFCCAVVKSGSVVLGYSVKYSGSVPVTNLK